MTLKEFNALDKEKAKQALFDCCGSSRWATLLIHDFPFPSEQHLVRSATQAWYDACDHSDYREAFLQHPKIGDVKSLEEKFASTKHLAGAEQAGVQNASANTIAELARGNADYEKKFGFIFIVCATGKTADEMLRLLGDRLHNSEEEELAVAMGEQHKITLIRLKKLLHQSDWTWMKVSQLTTHVLDTSIGKPAGDISILLQQYHQDRWRSFAQGVTNNDGRIADLLPPERILPSSTYKLVFETGRYFKKTTGNGFYPRVEIQFSIGDDQHYHVPLLLNPFGYSTYRGS